MNNFNSERELVRTLARFLQTDGFECFFEVPNMGQSVDLVLKKNGSLYLIEAKLKDWKRGLQQCRAHQLVADFICIAMGSNFISQELLNQANELGVGVLNYDMSLQVFHHALEPVKNQNYWKPQRTVFENNLFHHKAYEYSTLDVIWNI
jgi:Holliday junction resolvase